jgi:hypothetical protein
MALSLATKGRSVMAGSKELNKIHTAASAIAAFHLAQLSFSALVKNGIVPKADGERMLRQAIEANRTAGPGNRAAAELLAGVLKNVEAFLPATRQ